MSDSLEQALEAAVAPSTPEPVSSPEPQQSADIQTPPVTPAIEAATPEPVVTPAAQPETQPGKFDGLFDYVKQTYGFDPSAKYKTPEQFLNGALHAISKVGERDAFSQIGKQLQENPQAVYEYLKAQFGQESTVTAAQAAQTGKPEYDPNWIHVLEFDERGNPTSVKAGEDPGILTKYRTAKAYATKRHNDLLFHEDEVFGPREKKLREELANELRQEFEQKLEARFQGQQQVNQQTNEAYGFLTQHPEFFADPKDFTKGLSQTGHAFNQYMGEALQFGADPGNTPLLVNYALSKLQAAKPIIPPKPEPLSTSATAHRPNANLPPQGHRQIEDGEDLLTALQRHVQLLGTA